MSAGTLEGPDDLEARERRAVAAELFALADDEFVTADRYVEWQVRGPTLEADISIANIAQDELGHARLWYDLLADFGHAESALIWERPPGEWRHATLVERPFERGDWADCLVRQYLYDVAESLRLEALAESSYPRIADRVGKVQREEAYHREHARNWLERLAVDDDARSRLQAALDRLLPHALTLFEPVDPPRIVRGGDGDGGEVGETDAAAVEADVVELGVRPTPLSQLREDWLAVALPFLEGCGLEVPLDPADDPEEFLPDALGRDGTHTDAWEEQYSEFTVAYEYLDRDSAPRLMVDPEEA